jgi:glucose-1-phosphate cytidylyltransferase
MQVVILAGGLGSRLAEETTVKPKPMVEIGGKPILWHILSIYSHFGFNDFLIACGYKGHVIKDYFNNFYVHNSDWVVDLRNGAQEVVQPLSSHWRVGVLDTGLHTATGGRLRRLQKWLANETFLVTYGDGVADVDVAALVAFHRAHGRLATVTAVHPPSRFGSLLLDGCRVREFSEKPQTDNDWINGGFFVFEPSVFDYLAGDATTLERDALEQLAADQQLMAYCHKGFWQPMDTLREKQLLESLWDSGQAPWKLWKDPHDEPQHVLSAQDGPGYRPHRIQRAVAGDLA